MLDERGTIVCDAKIQRRKGLLYRFSFYRTAIENLDFASGPWFLIHPALNLLAS
jgi:hypothetical protein